MLGFIVANRLRENVKDRNLLARIMDLIKQDFKAVLVAGDDGKALKRLMPGQGE